MTGVSKYVLFFFLMSAPMLIMAQEDIEDLLNEEVAIDNPVYKPVISLGSGVFNFYGDVRNNFINPVIGDFAYKVNISAFVDPNRYFKANFFFIYGSLSADQRSYTDAASNLNFRTDLTDFGFNLEYCFDHFLKKYNTIRPFVSLGAGSIQFTSKGDLGYVSGGSLLPYNYWTDGTTRDLPQSDPAGSRVMRDFIFETDLRQHEKDIFELGKYSQNAFSIPIDVGIDFRITERVSCRLGTSLHLTTTDFIDNVSSTGTSIVGKKGNDNFTFNYFSFHFDLFSQPKTMIIEKMFAELEFDDVMFDDEDGDFIMDPVDHCPGTPYGIVVDSLGCPLDSDKDGVPDYLDLEPETSPGAWVDKDGKTVSEESYLAKLLARADAMSRADVLAYFELIGKGYVRKSIEEMPDKYKNLDTDKDGYLSFEELIKAIDDYFDVKLEFTVQDIYELNNFFFEQ